MRDLPDGGRTRPETIYRIWAVETLLNVTAARCFVFWHVQCCWRILLFVDKHRCTVRIKGNKAEESKREIHQILDRYWFENVRHIRDTKGAAAYLTLVGSKRDVCYPLHWRREQRQQRPTTVALSPQSPLHQQIVRLVSATWDSSMVGVGFDGVGLTHARVVVRQISVCQNDELFRKYDVNRKIMCMDASVNPYTPVTKLKAEGQIDTRKHIIGNNKLRTQNSTSFYAPQLYRQVLLRRVLAMGILSVRLSVTNRWRTKPRWDRDSGSSPYDSQESLVSNEIISCHWVKRFPSNEGIKEGYPP